LVIAIAGLRFTIIKEIRIRETTRRATAGMAGMTMTGTIFAATILHTTAPSHLCPPGISEAPEEGFVPQMMHWHIASRLLLHCDQSCQDLPYQGTNAPQLASDPLTGRMLRDRCRDAQISASGRRAQQCAGPA
jgi:hypothetical protein